LSRRLAGLEERLGSALFERSALGTRPTTAGERLLEPARRMAEWAAEVERAAERNDAGPRGIVRLTAPPGVAFGFVAPLVASLRESLPGVQLQVLSAVRYLDLTRREADLALRIEPPTQADLVSVASVELVNSVCAAPDYAASLPARRLEPAELDWVAWAPPLDRLPPNPQLEALVPGFRPAFASDDYLVQWRAMEAGAGAMVLARFPQRLDRAAPIETLDVDLGLHARSSIHLVSTRSALEISRVRAVADRLANALDAVGRSIS
jgi:DNA-binding transcriptional LysR family regulator